MSLSVRSRNHPLRLLLYLEWILLSVVSFSELLPRPVFDSLPRSTGFNLLGLGIFLLMGLRLPQRSAGKVAYTAIELGLLLWLSLGGGISLFSLLYLVFVIRNCFVFEQHTRSLTTLAAFVLCVLTQGQRLQSLPPLPSPALPDRPGLLWFSFAILFGLVVLFLQFLVTAVLAERHSREQLATANAQLRQYALRIEDQATLQERNRIAREIHDALGHSLTAVNLHLEAGLRLLHTDPAAATALFVEAKQIGSTVLQDVRQSVAALRSDPLQGRSLSGAIEVLIADFCRATGVTPHLQMDLPIALSQDVNLAAYRIVQEALTNIGKYANATQVEVQLQARPTVLQIRIDDNGCGFAPNQTTSGFGLQGMQERTLALAGSFQLLSAPSKGCQIIASLPLMQPERS